MSSSIMAPGSMATTTLVNQYYALTQKHRTETGMKTVVFMQCGKFFEVYGKLSDDDEQFSPMQSVHRICATKLAHRGGGGGPDSMMTGCPLTSLDKYVELMLAAGWTVAVYTQSDVPGRTDRSLTHLFTPGTFFSQNLGVSNNLLVIWVEFRPMSVARPHDALLLGSACLDNMAGTVTLDEVVCSPLRKDSSDYDWVQEVCVGYAPR